MPFIFNSGLPVMNTGVTLAVPKQFYCQSRTCQPRWSKSGQANAYELKPETPQPHSVQLKSFNFGNSTSDDEKGIVERMGPIYHVSTPPLEQEVEAPLLGPLLHPHYPEMCAVADCDFLPFEGNVSFFFFLLPNDYILII